MEIEYTQLIYEKSRNGRMVEDRSSVLINAIKFHNNEQKVEGTMAYML